MDVQDEAILFAACQSSCDCIARRLGWVEPYPGQQRSCGAAATATGRELRAVNKCVDFCWAQAERQLLLH